MTTIWVDTAIVQIKFENSEKAANANGAKYLNMGSGKHPLVSIVIPAHNSGSWIRGTINKIRQIGGLTQRHRQTFARQYAKAHCKAARQGRPCWQSKVPHG